MMLDDRAIPVKGSNIVRMLRKYIAEHPLPEFDTDMTYAEGWNDALKAVSDILYGNGEEGYRHGSG